MDYGYDVSTNPFDGYFTLITGRELVSQHVFRACLNAGLMDFLNERIETSEINYLRAQLYQELQNVECISRVISIEPTFEKETLTVKIVVEDIQGTSLDIVIDLDNLSVDFI